MRISQLDADRRRPVEERAVLVPAILAAGVVFSVVTWLRDTLHRWQGGRGVSRRATIQARGTADVALRGHQAARRDHTGERSRGTYLFIGICFVLFAAYLALGAWGNYVGWTHWAEGVAWLWTFFLLVSTAAAAVGVGCLVLAIRWDASPAWVRPLIADTPLASLPHTDETLGPARPLGPHAISDRAARRLRRAAAIWGTLVVGAFSILTILDRVPRSPEGDTLGQAVSQPAFLALLGLSVVGLILEWRHPVVGAVLLAVAGGGIAILSAVQYPPAITVAVGVLFAVPPALSWLAWQRTRSYASLAIVAGITAALLAGVGMGAAAVYDRYYGPAHPQSTIDPPPDSPVEWVWSGGVGPDTVTVVAGLRGEDRTEARLALSADAGLADARWSEVDVAEGEDDRVVRFEVTGLEPDRRYHYAVEVDGELDRVRAGTFRTFPVGPASFTVAFASCARTGSNGAVFDTIREREPLNSINTGDFNYGNVPDDDPGQFRHNMAAQLTAPAQAALYRSTSIAYVWDDHDYGGNDGDRTSPARSAAHEVYREDVPHHPLPLGPGRPIAQSFRIGRVTFVVTDLRSDRDPASMEDTAAKTMMGAAQEQWFVGQLAQARSRGDAIVWVNPTPWVTSPSPGSDSWAGYSAERRRLADTIVELDVADRLVMLSGDAHMVALDDGTHTDYSSEGTGGFPLLHAATLDRPGGVKGGPYTQGPFPGAGQFGELEVRDDGSRLEVVLRGLTWEEEVLVEESFVLDVPPA